MMPCEIIELVYISLSIVYLYLFNLLHFFLLSYSRLLLWHSSQILHLFFIVFKLKLLAIFIYKLTKTLNFSRNDDLNYLLMSRILMKELIVFTFCRGYHIFS